LEVSATDRGVFIEMLKILLNLDMPLVDKPHCSLWHGARSVIWPVNCPPTPAWWSGNQSP
jgi:hypothetical protein